MAETLITAELEPSCPPDKDTLCRRVEDLRSLLRCYTDSVRPPEFHKLMQECFADLQNRSERIDEEEPALHAFGSEDLETYVMSLKDELGTIEQENRALSEEILAPTTTMADDYSRLESNLLGLDNSLRQSNIQGCNDCQDADAVCGLSIIDNASTDFHFKKLELENLVENSCAYVSSLEDVRYELERNEAMGQVEDKFSDIEVMDFEGNCIRLTLKTCLKPLEGLLQKFDSVLEDTFECELLFEVADDTMELKNLKAFPSDVPLDDVIDAAKSSRYSLTKTISHVRWKIHLCTLRRLLVKIANDSRCPVEYMDREGTIIAHLVGGIDAHIKVSQGWPMSSCTLQLISIKGSSSDNSISLSLLCKIKELANSLDPEVRWDLSRFIDSIEEILILETQSSLERNSCDLHCCDAV